MWCKITSVGLCVCVLEATEYWSIGNWSHGDLKQRHRKANNLTPLNVLTLMHVCIHTHQIYPSNGVEAAESSLGLLDYPLGDV